MSRLVVNPGTPQAWDIPLRPGNYMLGRRSDCDFQINDPSVSGSHCRVSVEGDVVHLQDLGSTNGTFVNNAQVQEATLANGQQIRLGGVELVFDSQAAEAPILVPPKPVARPTLRVSTVSATEAEADTVHMAAPATVLEPPPMPEPAGARFCKFHPKSPARYLCRKCNRTFCEMCVTPRVIGNVSKKICRTCSVECVLLQAAAARSPVARGFFSRLPGVLIYPFRGSGVMILIVATLVFTCLQFVSAGLFAILFKIIALGYLFSFMQNIIHATAADEAEMPSLPGTDELFGAFFRLLSTVLVSFGVPIGLLIARLCEVDIPVSAILITAVLGSLYFPMAFLAVAMMDSAVSANPLVVLPAIFKVPLQYLVTAMLFASIFGIGQLGNLIMGFVKGLAFTTDSWGILAVSFGLLAAWSFVSVYLLTINMRILGLLYLANEQKIGWFKH